MGLNLNTWCKPSCCRAYPIRQLPKRKVRRKNFSPWAGHSMAAVPEVSWILLWNVLSCTLHHKRQDTELDGQAIWSTMATLWSRRGAMNNSGLLQEIPHTPCKSTAVSKRKDQISSLPLSSPPFRCLLWVYRCNPTQAVKMKQLNYEVTEGSIKENLNQSLWWLSNTSAFTEHAWHDFSLAPALKISSSSWTIWSLKLVSLPGFRRIFKLKLFLLSPLSFPHRVSCIAPLLLLCDLLHGSSSHLIKTSKKVLGNALTPNCFPENKTFRQLEMLFWSWDIY